MFAFSPKTGMVKMTSSVKKKQYILHINPSNFKQLEQNKWDAQMNLMGVKR